MFDDARHAAGASAGFARQGDLRGLGGRSVCTAAWSSCLLRAREFRLRHHGRCSSGSAFQESAAAH